jgi:hypothetical protein
MKNSFKIACLSVLMMCSGLRAMQDLNAQLLPAAEAGNEERVEELLANGANVNAKDNFDQTALMLAAIRAKDPVCNLLIASGADINAQTTTGKIALIYAAMFGNKSTCKLLIDKGAKINVSDIFDRTALWYAAKGGHIEVCRMLIDAGADANLKDEDGVTALVQNAKSMHSNSELCKLLIRAMIRPTKQQIDTVIALLGVKKRGEAEELNLIGRDAVGLIGKEKLAIFRQENKPAAQKQIMKIKDKALKKELLEYLNSL